MIDSWEDLRCFLAVANHGSMSAAAREMHISQPTIGRRIKSLERRLDKRLFAPGNNGYALTAFGGQLYEIAEQMERAVLSIERRVSGKEDALTGRVRVATTECIAVAWLIAQLPEFNRRWPDIEIEVITSIKLHNLFRRETDVALRVGTPGSEKLVRRKIGEVTFGLYGAESYLAAQGEPRQLSDLDGHRIIESSGTLSDLAQTQRLRAVAQNATSPICCDHLLTQLALVRAGIGLLAMPKYLTAIAPKLKRILPDQFDIKLDLWLLTHRDLEDNARHRVVREFLTESVRRHRAVFTD